MPNDSNIQQLLQNHGIFISANTPEEIRSLYTHFMDTLKAAYSKAGVSLHLTVAETPESTETEERIKAIFGNDAAFIASSGIFAYSPGPITP